MSDKLGASSVSSLEERIAKISHVGPWKLGSVGSVYVANHISTGQEVAIKVISTERIWSSCTSVTSGAEQADKAVRNMEREIVIMKLMEHPNVLTLLDVWESKGLLFVVMEYVNGGELYNHLVEHQRLSVPEALHYFQQIMYGVAYCHRLRIAHRDLKMENILLDKEGNVKIADFGMAVFTPRDSLLYTSCGSPHYASPEVVSAGKIPFDGESLDSVLGQVLAAQYTIPTDVPWPAQNLIRRMMERDTERRITVADILTHPFFRSVPPRSLPVLPPTFADLASAIPLGCVTGPIDSQVLKNMRALWGNRQDSHIVRAIRNKHDNWEKIAYHLLFEFRKKRLQCISPDDGHTSERQSPRSNQPTPFTSPRNASSMVPNTSIIMHSPMQPLERPSPPTPSRARSQGVSADFPVAGDFVASTVTAPLTPRKRNTVAPTSGSGDLPQIIIHAATPGRESAQVSMDDLLDYEDTNTRLFRYLDPGSCSSASKVTKVEPFVPLSGPDMQEDIFFQQVAEMLADVSQKGSSGGANPGTSQLHDTMSPQQLEIPLSVAQSPPMKATTPTFQEVDIFASPLQTVEPTIRMVRQTSILNPSEVNRSVRAFDGKTGSSQPRLINNGGAAPKSILAKPTQGKENFPGSPRRGTRAVPLNIKHGQFSDEGKIPPKKRVHIVTPDPSAPERTRKRPQSLGKEDSGSQEKWFSNLFNFRSTRQELHSLHDVFSTRERCISTLRALGARVEAGEPLPHLYGGCTLRCKMDEIVDPSGTVMVSKTLRFRVEIRPTTGAQYASGYLSELLVVQEKGQSASFNALCVRLRRGWDLDVTCQPDGSMDVLTLVNDSLLR
ncbi:Serine/threonine-protein kinase [Ceratobasidium sp. AG-Ba]|nr:Serine/threonine-protein kinase [Ceratobasidium sp. AG-Ba]